MLRRKASSSCCQKCYPFSFPTQSSGSSYVLQIGIEGCMFDIAKCFYQKDILYSEKKLKYKCVYEQWKDYTTFHKKYFIYKFKCMTSHTSHGINWLNEICKTIILLNNEKHKKGWGICHCLEARMTNPIVDGCISNFFCLAAPNMLIRDDEKIC